MHPQVHSQALRWCFTLNNYTEEELGPLRESLTSEARYAVFGQEVGEGGTPHLQGYVAFRKPKRFNAVKKVVCQRAHLEVAKGDEASNFIYCSKDGKFEEFGKRSSSGKRGDLQPFKDAINAGNLDPALLREEFSEVAARYPRFFDAYRLDKIPKPDLPNHPLRPWQAELSEKLKKAPDKRTVTFIVDYKGNAGKSWFAAYYEDLHPNTYIMRPGKIADMAYMLPDVLRVVFIDCTREQAENNILQYSFLESLKDGRVASPKYDSRIKLFGNMHVVVLMNQEPDMNRLSEDRYDIMRVSR